VTPGDRLLIIHGHFYQPPRENPWIEEIEVQDGAAPYHDWNQRITAECYGPNAAARCVGQAGKIIDIINNYAKISFNVGPTLLSYLEREAPAIYRKILEADRTSALERGGHGNAIAQAYNHTILPLANARDRTTQIRWGIADFTKRFGRAPRGMWLPECATDEDTLCRLADEGIEFTILAPRQARRHRALSSGEWRPGVDPRRPYRIQLSGNRSLNLFFYDGAVAQDCAFGGALRDRDTFVDRLFEAYGDTRGPGPWLVNVATDGETFGHHRAFGDMVLAAAIQRIEGERAARLTNYSQFLELRPPEHLVEIVSPSSWSCAHGVSRWSDDCGCSTSAQPGWNQRWRRPLRNALDDLRDRLAGIFERRGERLFRDPWAARDGYIEVLLDRERADTFLDAQAARPLSTVERQHALRLLEMQRHAMLMYTSCGWFFGELSGPEGVQVLKYAARAMQLAREVDGASLEEAFAAQMARARSNLPEQGDGARVLESRVKPSVVNLGGVVAHFAISSLFERYPPQGRIFCYGYQADDLVRRSRGGNTLAIGHVSLASEITRAATSSSFAILHFGGHDVRCAIGALPDLAAHETMKAELLRLFETGSVGDVVRAIDRHFAGREYGLSDLFLDERRKIVKSLVEDTLGRHRHQLQSVFEENRPLLRFLVEADTPVPGPLRAAANHALTERFNTLVADASFGSPRFDEVCAELVHVHAEARSLGVTVDTTEALKVFDARILDEATALSRSPKRDTARALLAYLELAESLEMRPNLWEAQNLFWALTLDGVGPRGHTETPPSDVDPDLMVRLGMRLGFDAPAIEPAWRDISSPPVNQLSA
jgi:alpha-amylase/alpha-mannosidase (GH57 family)